MDAVQRPKVFIVDCTNRDGVRTSRLNLSKLQKTMINVYLGQMGINESELGYAALQNEWNYINANVELEEIGLLQSMQLEGYARALPHEVEIAREKTNLKILTMATEMSIYDPKVHFNSEDHISRIIQTTTDSLDKAVKAGFEQVTIGINGASQWDENLIVRFAKICKEHGARRLRYYDTLGYDSPHVIYKRMRLFAEETKMDLEVHCHNDLGMAVANSVEAARGAYDGGVNCYINTTVNGIGERAGNADLISVILALRKCSGMYDCPMLDEQIQLHKAWRLANYTARAYGFTIPQVQVGVGSITFMPISRLHIDGLMKEIQRFQLFSEEELGHGKISEIELGRKVFVGSFTDVKGFRNVYGKLEIEFKNDEEAEDILNLVLQAQNHNQLPLTEDELRFIARFPGIAKKLLEVKFE